MVRVYDFFGVEREDKKANSEAQISIVWPDHFFKNDVQQGKSQPSLKIRKVV